MLGIGKVVEWSITAVLKTAVLRGTGGSNPSLSATKTYKMMNFNLVGFFCVQKSAPKMHRFEVQYTPKRYTFANMVE